MRQSRIPELYQVGVADSGLISCDSLVWTEVVYKNLQVPNQRNTNHNISDFKQIRFW